MTRKEERAQLMQLVQAQAPFLSYHDHMRLVTALLDGGYRYNPLVLREAAGAMRQTVSESLHLCANYLDRRATTMEDTL